jgi:hypothetical protein
LTDVVFEEGDPVVLGDPELFTGGPHIVIGTKVEEGPPLVLVGLDHIEDL